MRSFYLKVIIGLCLLLLSIEFAIAGEFEDKLKAAGISQEAIDALLRQDYSDVGSLQNLTVENLVSMGVKRATAERIVTNFGKKEQQPFDKMSVEALLNYLLNDPANVDALKALKQQSLVQEVSTKTQNWAVVDTKDKKLDVKTTWEYLNFLKKDAAPKNTFRNKAVVAIEIALGQSDDVIRKHPLLSEELGTDGIDSNGLNWLKVPVNVRKALFWAKIQNPRHHLFPTQPEQAVFDFYKEASKSPLEPGIVQRIVTEYLSALLRKDAVADDVQKMKMPE